MEKIRKYYLLCNAETQNNSHIIEQVPADLNKVFSKMEYELYFMKIMDNIIVTNIIIGGDSVDSGISDGVIVHDYNSDSYVDVPQNNIIDMDISQYINF